ncbi:hypothetical protein BJ138DRAFT_1100870 [Hygrophoropsis aurantiaca]|uniref:Uncharacterized protein n=1 Tax=Hygrophoropsis aurantiaca TaxID=72124 RepID=A0ACB8AG45_9AGAM|nr:hypothetical protein BJ138DRAFT_1100870 [Hygrophoropsis aurantiaca]
MHFNILAVVLASTALVSAHWNPAYTIKLYSENNGKGNMDYYHKKLTGIGGLSGGPTYCLKCQNHGGNTAGKVRSFNFASHNTSQGTNVQLRFYKEANCAKIITPSLYGSAFIFDAMPSVLSIAKSHEVCFIT